MENIVWSERQIPRALQLLRELLSDHLTDPGCIGSTCGQLISLKAEIASLEARAAAQDSNEKTRSASVK